VEAGGGPLVVLPHGPDRVEWRPDASHWVHHEADGVTQLLTTTHRLVRKQSLSQALHAVDVDGLCLTIK
jgi:hypothetical protein